MVRFMQFHHSLPRTSSAQKTPGSVAHSLPRPDDMGQRSRRHIGPKVSKIRYLSVLLLLILIYNIHCNTLLFVTHQETLRTPSLTPNPTRDPIETTTTPSDFLLLTSPLPPILSTNNAIITLFLNSLHDLNNLSPRTRKPTNIHQTSLRRKSVPTSLPSLSVPF